MERPFVAENNRERERLAALTARLTDEELTLPLEMGWTIASAFAHLAFWDQRAFVLMRKWRQSGVAQSLVDDDVTNDALLPIGLAIPPRVAANLAIAAAEAIDHELEQTSAKLIDDIAALGDKFRLWRSIHRRMHLDQIEARLAPGKEKQMSIERKRQPLNGKGTATRLKADDLHTFTEKVFQAVGVPKGDAQTAATVMVEASLCGVDSHGVRMLPGYITLIRNGKINPKGPIEVIKETPVIAHLDGNLGLGSVVGSHAMPMAVAKAKNSGVGFILVRNSTHWGRAAYYSVLAARQGCIGICFVNTESNMPIWGAKEPRIGNNPLSISAPRTSGEPVVLDMAMSQAAWYKLVVYDRLARKVPFGWGLDNEGKPTDDPAAILKSKRMVPMGQHKGSGLSLMIDIMTGILSGGRHCGELLEERKGQPWAWGYSQAFIAIDIASFTPLEEFQRRVDELVVYVKGAQLAEGFSEISVPGERTWMERALRERDGIPIDEITLEELGTLAHHLGVPAVIGIPE